MRHGAVLAWLALVLTACSGETAAPDKTDAGGDGLAQDATSTGAGDGSVVTCPGGPGCVCTTSADCETGQCLEQVDGSRACARPCGSLGCGLGHGCGSLPVGEAQGLFCIDRAIHLCEPCTATAACALQGLPGAACVDYGDAGAYCGAACLGDGDCGEGYRCQVATRLEGGQVQQCVRVGVGSAPGECPCNARAKAAKRSTGCRAPGSGCKGVRACGEAGLSACSALPPSEESCNGLDDDCDGLTDETTCNDNNACTTDSCDPSQGCKHAGKDGPCSDGDACTEGDACKEGACSPGAAPVCDDGNPCSTDSCDKLQGCVHAYPGSVPCDDGDGCTVGDTCQGSVCVSGKALICDDKNPCTQDQCDAATGKCASSPHDGSICSDGNPCTIFDTCTGGACVGKTDACDDGNPCTTDGCDPKVGCTHANSTGPCDDANPCTSGEACESGKCAGGVVKSCAAADECLLAFCSPATGQCASQAKAPGTACSDGSACSEGDACKAGKCVGTAASCDDGNPCTDDGCAASTGCSHVPNAAPCSDGNACTTGDKCAGGQCVGAALEVSVTCDDKSDCTTDTCDPKSGCAHANSTGACDDGNACTTGDACDKGVCVAGVNGCTCKTDGDCASQEDGNACNGTLTCEVASGACKVKAGTAVTCATTGDTACSQNTCDTTTGKCAMLATAEGKPCDDADACTTGDVCATGLCKGASGTCDDKNPCTDDSCDTSGGCVHTANSAACDGDGNLCTVDACSAKVCLPGAATLCDDSNACTTDSCDTKTGKCVFTGLADGASCSDGDACTTPDACKSGQCVGTVPASSSVTLAGSGSAGFSDGKGAQAKFKFAGTVATQTRAGLGLGADGTLYVADTGNERIRKVLVDGTVTTLAGDGIMGFVDGPGAQAEFWDPAAVAVASDGTVYVADRLNQRIRKVLADGTTSTLAGDAPPPELIDAKALGAYQDGKGTAARFDEPAGLAFSPDGSALYVVEAANHRVRKVLLDGTVTTVAGSGTAGFADGKGILASFNKPQGIAVASDGVVYVADTGNLRIRAIAPDGTVTTVAGSGTSGLQDGAALTATFKQPWGLTIGADGTLYVADTLGHALRAIAGGQVKTFAGTGAPGFHEDTLLLAQFNQPTGIALAAPGVWYVTDALNHRIRKLNDPTVACPPKK
jgi:sugar lactone lactonase YvrE